jgi:signal peptidase
MKTLRVIILSIGALISTVIVVMSLLAVKNGVNLTSSRAYIILSGSMEPIIKVGGVAIVAPYKNYSSNDIISFYQNGDKKNIVTHRIQAKLYPNGINKQPVYLTSGDANNALDQEKVTQDQITGKVIFSIPYLGYLANFVQTPYGLILFVIIPATIIVYEEAKKVKDEILSFFKKLRLKRQLQELQSGIVSKDLPGKITLNKYFLILIFFMMASFTVTSLSLSYFSDREHSSANSFQAGIWTTPIPTTSPIPIATLTPIPLPTSIPTPTATPIPTLTLTPTLAPSNCASYCISLGTYTAGNCRQNDTQCRINGETYEVGGDLYCTTGGPSADTCCCVKPTPTP